MATRVNDLLAEWRGNLANESANTPLRVIDRSRSGNLSFTHNFLRYEESDLYVSEACKSAP